MRRAVLAGYGEVGKGVYGALKGHHIIHIEDPGLMMAAPVAGEEHSYDALLIAIPYSEKFIDIVRGLEEKFLPIVTIIFSTVPIGTCSKLGAIHSPIEGKHDNMVESIRHHARWLGGYNRTALDFFEQAGLRVRMVNRPEITEFMKLQSLAIYGINLEWARYCKTVSDELGFNYEHITEYNNDYNYLVATVHKKPEYIRYNLDPPVGKIGGHCVLQNAELLHYSKFDHPFIQILLDLNKEK